MVQLLKALVVPSQKVLSSDARVEDEGQDNPVLILDRSVSCPIRVTAQTVTWLSWAAVESVQEH